MRKIMMSLAFAAVSTMVGAATTTYTVSNTNSSISVENSLPWALKQVAENTTLNSPSGGVFRIKFAPAVYGCRIPANPAAVTIKSVQAKVVLDGTGSGVTIVDPASPRGTCLFDIQISGASLFASNLTFSTSRSLVNSYGGKVEVEGCRFEGCRTASGLIRRETNGQAGYTKIERTTFIDNATSGTGDMAKGACVNVTTGRLMLNHCSFINNRSSKVGGAVYSNTTNLSVIANCSFVGNNSTTYPGGAVYFDSKTQQGFLVESMFFNNDQRVDAVVFANSNTVRVTEVNCGYEMFLAYGTDISTIGGREVASSCEQVCGTEEPRFATKVVSGVRQTAPFPSAKYSGNEGDYTFQHNADWTIGSVIARVPPPSASLVRNLWGGVLTSGTMDPVDIFGTAKPTSASGKNPTVGAVQYYQETPSLTVTTLEDIDCPSDGEISFREAVRYAADYLEFAVDRRAAIAFAPSVVAQAVSSKLVIPITEGDIVFDPALSDLTLVVAPPAGLRLDFCGATNAAGRVAAGRLFKLAKVANLELRDADVRNFQPVYGSGGALYLEGDNTVVVSNVLFMANGVTQYEAGGAIYAGPCTTLKAYGSSFHANEAGCCGGAVYLADSTEAAYAHFERVTIYGNTTRSMLDDEGGAVYAGGGRVVFVNASILQNNGHTAALQVRPGADMTLVNTFVNEGIIGTDLTGAVINVADDATAAFRLVNSVVGGYRTLDNLKREYCQLRMGAKATKRFVNSIVSANNEVELPEGQEKPFAEYTEQELHDYVFRGWSSKTAHGVNHYFFSPRLHGPLFGAGMEIYHNAAWTTIQAHYGTSMRDLKVIEVMGSSRVHQTLKALATDILDCDYSGSLDTPQRQRTIGPVWAATNAELEQIPDYHAKDTENGCQITVSAASAGNYLPQICGGRFVKCIRFAANVGEFDPLCAKTAKQATEYIVAEGNPCFKAVGGSLYSADGLTYVAMPPNYPMERNLIVVAGVETVGSNAFAAANQARFQNYVSLWVTLPDTVTAFEDGAFAGLDGVNVLFHGMSAPDCTDAAFADSTNVTLYVPEGSTGWDGDPDSTEPPEDFLWHGVDIDFTDLAEYPSLQVTTLEDVVDPMDGLISLREALGYASLPSLAVNGRLEITFAPGLPVNVATSRMESTLKNGALWVDLYEGYDEDLVSPGQKTVAIMVPDGQMLTLIGSHAEQESRRCFNIESGTRLELHNLEIRQFDSSGEEENDWYGGAIFMDLGSALVASNCHFRVNGSSCGIVGSENTEGGVLFVRRCCDARFYDCCLSDNQAAAGSAVSIEGSEFEDVPFVLFERTCFAGNRAYYPYAEDGWGGAVNAGILSRVVFNTCSFVANEGFISDLNVLPLADVTMVNSAVSDSVAEWGDADMTGTAVQVHDEEGTVFRAVNCVFGGYGDNAKRAKNYRQLSGGDPWAAQADFVDFALVQLVNTIVANPGPSGSFGESVGSWCHYTEADFTNYVYDVTANNTTTATGEVVRREFTDATKYFRPLGRDSVLYGTGVGICHDANWENIAWRYGDEKLHELVGEAEQATIPVTKDLLGNDWVGTCGLSSRQRNIGPLGAWDRAGDFEAAARAIPDYRRTLVGDYDMWEHCRIRPPATRRCLPPVCGGLVVQEVEVGPGVTSVNPGWIASATSVAAYAAVDNPIFSSGGNCLYTNTPNGKVLVAAPAALIDIMVQSGTCGIGVDAFRYAHMLETVEWPSSLRYLESGAFAGCNCEVYAHMMQAPTYAADSFLGSEDPRWIYVQEGSKGWNGNPNSTVLPETWPVELGAGGLMVESYEMTEYPSLVVTTGEDVQDSDDGVISLREALDYLSWEHRLFDNRRAVVTFDPALAGADGVIDIQVDEDLGTMRVESVWIGGEVTIAAPEGCRVRIRGCDGGSNCLAGTGLFELAGLEGTYTFAGLDIEGFSGEHAGAIWNDWGGDYIGEIVITNCTFRNCWGESDDGGAVCVGAVMSTVVDSVFDGNHQCDPSRAGGGLALHAGPDGIESAMRVERCSFIGNHAQTGGGLALFGGGSGDRIDVVNTSILDNETAYGGAGVWVSGPCTAKFTHVSVFGNVSSHQTDDWVMSVDYQDGAKLELYNCVLTGSTYGNGSSGYVNYDIVFGRDTPTDVRAFNSVFGAIRKAVGVSAADYVGCTAGLATADWFNPVSTVTNSLTRLPMRVRTPVAGGSATTFALAATDVALDQLGLPRTSAFNAVGAIAADPADRPAASGYAAWAAAQGLTGADAAWDAKPAKWGGELENAFVYTFGEGLVDGSAVLMSISFDADDNPVITTTPVVDGHDDFNCQVIGAPTLHDWSAPVPLNRNGNDWTLPAGKSANFFRVRLSE